jgi:hypothetical protein
MMENVRIRRIHTTVIIAGTFNPSLRANNGILLLLLLLLSEIKCPSEIKLNKVKYT